MVFMSPLKTNGSCQAPGLLSLGVCELDAGCFFREDPEGYMEALRTKRLALVERVEARKRRRLQRTSEEPGEGTGSVTGKGATGRGERLSAAQRERMRLLAVSLRCCAGCEWLEQNSWLYSSDLIRRSMHWTEKIGLSSDPLPFVGNLNIPADWDSSSLCHSNITRVSYRWFLHDVASCVEPAASSYLPCASLP